MKITTHGSHLIQLTRWTAFNCFLVREDDGFTLVDTGMSGSASAILQAADSLGAPIRRILLTHAHIDHVGSLDALHARLPDAEVAISARDARFLTGDRALDPAEPQTPLRGGYPTCSTRPTRLLANGDRIGSLEAIATPGHTPGHLAFFDHRDGTLIAGDAYSTKAGISTGGTLRLLFPFPAMATWNRETATHSAETLLKWQPTRLAVGHGPTLENPAAAMSRAIAGAKRQLK
ncbi:MAG: MBL fold metallo-hydrolase [Anaerolineae bacterium]|nr:MBL fold metallo-hydrolase [Anaerolineae bacterium]